MTKFVIAYLGGTRPETPEAGAAFRESWTAWIADLGDAAIDPASPVGACKSISTGEITDCNGDDKITGYTTIEAPDIDAAVAMAKGCPHLGLGGKLQVGQIMQMGG